MTPKQIALLNQACQMAGIDSSKISATNPFKKSGQTPAMLQALHHTSQQNAADRAACRALVEGGWGTDQEYVAWRNQ